MIQVENNMVNDQLHIPKNVVQVMFRINCGCGRIAKWEVYEHAEPHCDECFVEAASCGQAILVRKV